MASNLIQSRYSLNSVGSSTTTSMMSLSSDDYGDRNIFSPRPSSPTHGNQGMGMDADPNSPESVSPSVSPLPPRHNYSLAHHITMEENVTDKLQVPYNNNGSRNRAMSESNYNENRNLKRGESFSSVASSTDSAKARVSSRNSRNMRRVKSCKNTSRCGSSMSRQSGSTSSLNKKPLADNKKTAYNRNEVTFNIRPAMFGRRGWMVMPTDDNIDLKQFKPEVLDSVTSKIRTMELSGVTVPDQIKIRLSEC